MNTYNSVSSTEKKLIKKFILTLTEKKYAVADKYLKKIVETKLNKKLNSIINNF